MRTDNLISEMDAPGFTAAALRAPTYYVQHPDGTYSSANPQPRFAGDHRPLDLLVEAGYVGREVANFAMKIVRDADGPNIKSIGAACHEQEQMR